MTERVILGTRGSEIGFWVSKPGKSANSTDASDFLVDTSHDLLRPIRNGIITNPVLTRDGSSTGPTKTQSGWYYVEPKDQAGHSLYQYNGDTRYDDETYVSDGFALFTKKYFYNADHSSLGFRPLVHVSIGSDTAGDAYPRIYVDEYGITLSHRELWQGSRQRASEVWDTYWPNSTNIYGVWYFNGTYTKKSTHRRYWYENAPKNSSFQTNCTIHYTVYARSW